MAKGFVVTTYTYFMVLPYREFTPIFRRLFYSFFSSIVLPNCFDYCGPSTSHGTGWSRMYTGSQHALIIHLFTDSTEEHPWSTAWITMEELSASGMRFVSILPSGSSDMPFSPKQTSTVLCRALYPALDSLSIPCTEGFEDFGAMKITWTGWPSDRNPVHEYTAPVPTHFSPSRSGHQDCWKRA